MLPSISQIKQRLGDPDFFPRCAKRKAAFKIEPFRTIVEQPFPPALADIVFTDQHEEFILRRIHALGDRDEFFL